MSNHQVLSIAIPPPLPPPLWSTPQPQGYMESISRTLIPYSNRQLINRIRYFSCLHETLHRITI